MLELIHTLQFLLCAQACLPCLLISHMSPLPLAFGLFLLSDSDSNDGDQGKDISVAT